jgi:hypothetical protein
MTGGGAKAATGLWRSVRAKLLAHSIDEELDATTTRAHVDVEMLPVLEELGEIAENTPAGAFVEFLGAHVLEAGCAARAVHRVGCGHVSLRENGCGHHC